MKEAFTAVSGPAFEMVIVQEMLSPAFAVPGPFLTIPTLADETLTKVELLLFSGFGSGVAGGVEVTVTVFWYSVPALSEGI